MATNGIALGAPLPINHDEINFEGHRSPVDVSPAPTLTPTPDNGSPSSEGKFNMEKREYNDKSQQAGPHQTPVYTRASESNDEPASPKRPAAPARNSTFGSVVSRVRSGRSQRNEYPDDDVSSFERAVSRRSEAEKDGWSLKGVMEREKERDDREGRKPRRLDVSWKNLCVRGVGADAVFADDLKTMFNPMTKRNDKKMKSQLQPDLEKSNAPKTSEKSQKDAEKVLADNSSKLGKNEKFLIEDFTGVLKSGEMALVLGRPGAGCTTFMKAMTNIKQGYAGIDGEIKYGAMDSTEAERYPGQIIFVAEDEVF